MTKTLLKTRQVCEKMQCSRTQIYYLMETKEFPKPIKFSTRSQAWDEAEIDSWIEDRAEQRAA